jgi:hypothetical protein
MQTRSGATGVEFPVSSTWVSRIACGTFYRSYEMTEIRHNIFHREMHLVNQVKRKSSTTEGDDNLPPQLEHECSLLYRLSIH